MPDEFKLKGDFLVSSGLDLISNFKFELKNDKQVWSLSQWMALSMTEDCSNL